MHVARCRHCGCSSDFSCGGKNPWGSVSQPSRLYYQGMPAKVHIRSNNGGGIQLSHLRQQKAPLLHERQPLWDVYREQPSPERQRGVPRLDMQLLQLLQASAVPSGVCSSCCGTAAPQATWPQAEPATHMNPDCAPVKDCDSHFAITYCDTCSASHKQSLLSYITLPWCLEVSRTVYHCRRH